jgi:DNA invertase Pin-like site-specific DNA recombinase
MKAVGYIRVSTEDQAREGVSLDNQRAKIQAYCNLKDLELTGIIEDAGVSAKNLNRTGVQQVIESACKKKVDAVVVYKLDRMFRSTVDALETTRKFDKWGVSFHSIQETLDTQSAMGRFLFNHKAGLAEMERGIIGERTRAALRHKRAKGEKTGGDVPYGYNVDEAGILIRNETEQKAIRLIHQLRLKGYSLRTICRELEREGHKTKTGKTAWNPKTVSMILKRAVNE